MHMLAALVGQRIGQTMASLVSSGTNSPQTSAVKPGIPRPAASDSSWANIQRFFTSLSTRLCATCYPTARAEKSGGKATSVPTEDDFKTSTTVRSFGSYREINVKGNFENTVRANVSDSKRGLNCPPKEGELHQEFTPPISKSLVKDFGRMNVSIDGKKSTDFAAFTDNLAAKGRPELVTFMSHQINQAMALSIQEALGTSGTISFRDGSHLALVGDSRQGYVCIDVNPQEDGTFIVKCSLRNDNITSFITPEGPVKNLNRPHEQYFEYEVRFSMNQEGKPQATYVEDSLKLSFGEQGDRAGARQIDTA